MNNIALDALASALERGDSIDTDELRDTVVELYTAYVQKPAEPDDSTPDEDPDPPSFKGYGPLPRA